MSDKAPKYRTEIQQMMFVSGETGEPSIEVTTLVEQMVLQQVQEMIRECSQLATRRGSRGISTDDMMMIIRHDRPKLSRLRHFLQWKDVRKNAKESSEDKGGGGDPADLGDDAFGMAGGTASSGPISGQGQAGPAMGVDLKKNRKNRVDLAWDVPTFFSEVIPASIPRPGVGADDEDDEEDEEMTLATIQRLKSADERTKNMSKEDYMHWSECRQASFTFRKTKRFREWVNFGLWMDGKPNDDVVDILGFLTFETVQTITEEALLVKQKEDSYKKRSGAAAEAAAAAAAAASGVSAGSTAAGGDGGSGGEGGGDDSNPRKRKKRELGLFDWPEEAREPITVRHVQEGFRRLQFRSRRERAMLNHTGLGLRTTLKMI